MNFKNLISTFGIMPDATYQYGSNWCVPHCLSIALTCTNVTVDACNSLHVSNINKLSQWV